MSRILLIDDDPDLSALMVAALRNMGAEVIEGRSRDDAETLIEHTHVDLMVIDGQLGQESGVDTIEYLRRRRHLTLPIVFITAAMQDLDTFNRLIEDLDVDLVFYKPFDPKTFAGKVIDLIPSFEASEAIEDESTVADQLRQLRQEFAASLPAKLRTLEASIQEARVLYEETDDITVLSGACALAHRLHGSAGSYGYAAVGSAVADVERLLEEAIGKGQKTRRYFWRELNTALRDANLSASRAPFLQTQVFDSLPKPKGSVLLVDDDVDFLRMAKSTAANLMIDVVTVESGPEAVHRAKTQEFIAAVVDVNLDEESNAFDVAMSITKTRGNKEIPIAFISANADMSARVEAIAAGGSRFFEKPLTPEKFASALQSFVTDAQYEKGRVVVVEDAKDTRELIVSLVRANGYSVQGYDSAENLIQILEQTNPDLLVLDVQLPRISGLDVCRSLRMSERWSSLPILICTITAGVDARVRAFKAGATDIIAKPIVPEEFIARIESQIDRSKIIRDRSETDPLTGLMARAALLDALEREASRASRQRQPYALALIDLDQFKQINDTYGHQIGDTVLSKFGALLRHKFRKEDLRGRWGGEEFLLVFAGQDANFATQATWDVLQEFDQLLFKSESHGEFRASFTAGIASYPEDGSSINALIRCADERLYAGKKAGRNRVIGPESITELSEVIDESEYLD